MTFRLPPRSASPAFFMRENSGQPYTQKRNPLAGSVPAAKKEFKTNDPVRDNANISAQVQVIPQTQTVALDNTTVNQRLAVVGNVLMINFATDSTVTVQIGYHSPNNPKMTVGKNFFLAGFSFQEVYLSWTGQAGKTIEVTVIADPNPQQYIRVE